LDQVAALIRTDDATYCVALPTADTVTRLERKVFEVALGNVEELQGVLPPKDYEALWFSTMLQAERSNEEGGKFFTTMLSSPVGRSLQLWACLTHEHPELTVERVEEIVAESPTDATLAMAVVMVPLWTLWAERLPEQARPAAMKYLAEFEAGLRPLLEQLNTLLPPTSG